MKKIIKIIEYRKIDFFRKYYQNKNSVLVGGCFDIFHYGHLQFLKKAKKEGDYLIVALESDEFIKKNKREKPIHSQKERAEILSSLNFVDMVILLPFFSSYQEYFKMVEIIKPKIIAVTEGDPQIENKKKQIEKLGGRLKVVTPLLKKFSTRKIVGMFD